MLATNIITYSDIINFLKKTNFVPNNSNDACNTIIRA